MQTLDDLVFVYCDTIIKLQPKVFLLENVKGIIQGNAKAYSKAIVKKMQEAGYTVQVFCLNAASMGVPQKRERVFFIGHKKEFLLPKLN
jgi:DNA (cytosine-5)-methyltransferase 1